MIVGKVIKSSPVFAFLATCVAYPWAVILVPLLVIGLTRNTNGTVMLMAFIAALVLGTIIALPRLARLVAGIQRAWANLVFETWKIIETKRLIKQSEKRMRETVVSEARPMQDLGGDLDAS